MMKLLPFALLLVTFAFVPLTDAQVPTESDPTTLLHRPTPTPGPTSTSNPKKPFEASLSSNEKAKSSDKSTTVFPSSTKKIYVNFENDPGVKGDKLRLVWIAEDAKPYPKNKKITENGSVMPGPGTFGSYFLAADGLPVGKYDAQLSLNGKVVKDLKFTVVK